MFWSLHWSDAVLWLQVVSIATQLSGLGQQMSYARRATKRSHSHVSYYVLYMVEFSGNICIQLSNKFSARALPNALLMRYVRRVWLFVQMCPF